MGGRPACVELATWCGLCFGHLWFQSAFCRLYLKQGHNGETKAPVGHFFYIAFNSLRLLQVILPFHGVLGCVE